jgi:hypothetical protein
MIWTILSEIAIDKAFGVGRLGKLRPGLSPVG